jgi:hypothetical protein
MKRKRAHGVNEKMKFPGWTSAACVSMSLAFGFVACAAAEKQAAKEAAEIGSSSLKTVITRLAPLFRRAGVATEAALGRQVASWTLKSEQRVVFRSFEAVRPRVRWRVVRRDVKAFVRAFEAGAHEPEQHFADPLVDPALVARWKATPKRDRIFVAGAQQDTAVIESLRAQLEHEGKTVFFYRFCAGATGALCESATVGAFFGTAGTAVLAVSDASGTSRFVPQEIEAGIRLAAHQSQLVILTPGEALTNAAGTRMVEATVDGPASP